MENVILEKETETLENQIEFDFLETKTMAEDVEWNPEQTIVLLLNEGKIGSGFYLCGKTMLDWVKMATSGCKQVVLDVEEDDDVLDVARPFADDVSSVAVFYTDTPLLQKTTFIEIMNYFASNDMNFLKLARGYVFKADFLKNSKMMMSAGVKEFGQDDFAVVNDAQTLSYAFKVLNGRILNYHKQNGVVMFGEDTIFVDADVEIEAGTVIYPNNTIKGQSYIGRAVILESGNYIIDSLICDGAFICQSYIENGKVESEKTIGPFARIIKGKV